MKSTVQLTRVERDSQTWKKVELEIANRLAAHRAKVENPDVSEPDRLGLCWRIRELKELLKLGDQQPEPQQDAG